MFPTYLEPQARRLIAMILLSRPSATALVSVMAAVGNDGLEASGASQQTIPFRRGIGLGTPDHTTGTGPGGCATRDRCLA